MKQKGFVKVALIILVVFFVGILGYLFLVKKKIITEKPQSNRLQDDQQNLSLISNNSTITSTTKKPIIKSETEDWKTFNKEEYNFSFKYPMYAKLSTFPGNTTILSHTEIEFEKESSFYNRATIAFFVYPKGVFQHYPQSDKCKIYQRSTKIIDGKNASVVEQSDCLGSEGSPTGGSGHTLTVIISLSGIEDLVYTANLNNSFIAQNNFGTKILDTLKF